MDAGFPWFFQTPREELALRGLPKLFDQVSPLSSAIQVMHHGEGRVLSTPEIEGLRAL